MSHGWHIVRVKREWVPEWMWKALGQSVLYQPMRAVFSRELTPEEAAEWWGEEGR